jgi:hypothetical protein
MARHAAAHESTDEAAGAQEPAFGESSPAWDRGRAAQEAAQSGSFAPQGMEAFTPLSEADLGTLASIGVEPSDGMGALRLLAALVRILNRGQHIEPDELRAEIHQSLAQGAMAAASLPPSGLQSDVATPGEPGSGVETAET